MGWFFGLQIEFVQNQFVDGIQSSLGKQRQNPLAHRYRGLCRRHAAPPPRAQNRGLGLVKVCAGIVEHLCSEHGTTPRCELCVAYCDSTSQHTPLVILNGYQVSSTQHSTSCPGPSRQALRGTNSKTGRKSFRLVLQVSRLWTLLRQDISRRNHHCRRGFFIEGLYISIFGPLRYFLELFQ